GGHNSESLVSLEVQYNKIILAGRFYNYTVIDGDSLFSTSGTDIFVAKFDLNGDLLNSHVMGGASVDMVSDMAMDVEGNIYLVGDFYSDIYFSDDYHFDAGDLLGIYLAKLNPSLDVEWAYQVVGDDLKPGVKVDVSPLGVATISGGFTSSVQFGNTQLTTAIADEDIYMASFSNEADVNWAQRFYSSSMESVVDVNVDRLGDIYISGHYLSDIHFGNLILNYSLC
ncbi:MAG: hypothetical protein GQ527_08805, partial [Bacteroidales bacterium]|nr:hypothetical protein [Bacteroidales bacterium]